MGKDVTNVKGHITTGYYFTQQFYKSSERKCCLHADESRTVEPIILFNGKSLKKSRQVLQKRKERNLKYAGIAFLSIVDHQSGYHMSCYRKFIALPKKHRLEEKEKVTTKLESMSRRSLNESFIISSTGIFKPVCIFCNQSRKRSGGKTLDLICAASKEIENSIIKFAQ